MQNLSRTSISHLRGGFGRQREIWGVVCAAATVLVALSLWSYDLGGNDNWVGVLGASLAGFLVSAFGLGACVVPVELGVCTVSLLGGRNCGLGLVSVASTLVVMFVGCAMLHLALGEVAVFGGHLAGGVLGEVLGEVMRSLLGSAGAFVTGASLLLITLLLRTSLSLVGVLQKVVACGMAGTYSCGRGMGALWEAWGRARALEKEERERAQCAAQPRILQSTERTGSPTAPEPAAEDAPSVVASDEADEPGKDDRGPEPSPVSERRQESRRRRSREPLIVRPRAEDGRAAGGCRASATGSRGRFGEAEGFVLPPVQLLAEAGESALPIDEETLRQNASRLVEKLAAYGVDGRVDEIHPGPVVTMYEFEPASGTKVSKIASLSDDLAMALAAQKVRIVAPIPGKARVGFELPNEVRQTVVLRELLEEESWQNMDSALPMAFGKDIAGRPVYGDLSRMPHLLVAGATGSGKSVGLAVMMLSLLTKKSPEQVRLLMIDPKVVELAVFDGIPHMLLPVVTDMKKAALALRWAVDEMERRYQLFADAGARNISTYNDRVVKVLRGEMPASSLAPKRQGKVRAQAPDGSEMLLDPSEGERPDAQDAQPCKLPHVVLVVDEFSDLMMVAAKDVEASIARLAQKARAAGIHVILATQRPSVDVITGMIKANFPCRIAYKVSQREDSKTILGRNGAENLLGNGDMLTLMPGSGDVSRVHSAFVQEAEVKAVCDFLRTQGAPVYDEEILKPRDDDVFGTSGAGDSGDNSLYDRAVAIVAQAGYCSVSHIQRNLSVGYNKAAKLVERMEKEGVVGPPSQKAGGRREVLIQPW